MKELNQKQVFEEIYTTSIETGDTVSNVRFLEKAVVLRPPVLEIGAGRGYVLNWLYQKGIEATGLEISEEAIRCALQDFPGIQMMQYEGRVLPFPAGSVETVISFDVLEHFPDVNAHLADVRRVLRPNGFYAFQTPNILTNLPKEIICRGGFKKAREFHPSVQSYYGLKQKLKRNGFAFTFVKMPLISSEKYEVLKTWGWGWRLAVTCLAKFPEGLVPFALRPNFWVVAQKIY